MKEETTQPDAFHHHYQYDADNRITDASTSHFVRMDLGDKHNTKAVIKATE